MGENSPNPVTLIYIQQPRLKSIHILHNFFKPRVISALAATILPDNFFSNTYLQLKKISPNRTTERNDEERPWAQFLKSCKVFPFAEPRARQLSTKLFRKYLGETLGLRML
jgi:hypothetical protein